MRKFKIFYSNYDLFYKSKFEENKLVGIKNENLGTMLQSLRTIFREGH